MTRDKNIYPERTWKPDRKMCRAVHPKKGIICTRSPGHENKATTGAATHYNLDHQISWKGSK